MPKRLFDGDKAYKSDKLRAFAERHPQWRAEYAWLKGLVLADGTFEADPHRVWAEAYSFTGNGFDAKIVEKMLNAFENFGLLERKTDESGKIWGYWSGCEDCLPVKKERWKYKTGAGYLFNEEQVTSERLASQQVVNTPGVRAGFGSGLGEGAGAEKQPAASSVGSCLDEINQELINGNQEPAIAAGNPGFIERGKYKTRNPKRVHRLLSLEWSAIMGKHVYCPYPERYPTDWENLCDQISAELLVPAFQLWAKEEGAAAGRFPTEDFRKVAHLYLQRLFKPKKTLTKAQLDQTDLNMKKAWCVDNPGHAVVDGKIVRTAPQEVEPGPDALFGPEETV